VVGAVGNPRIKREWGVSVFVQSMDGSEKCGRFSNTFSVVIQQQQQRQQQGEHDVQQDLYEIGKLVFFVTLFLQPFSHPSNEIRHYIHRI
jgi:hypothetical protein